MKLSELLAYDNIVIQCHDNPDADTIACGFGVYLYLKSKGKEPRLIYGGQNVIRKTNLVMLIRELKIPIEHVDYLHKPELLVMVDCQYHSGNSAVFEAEHIAGGDHGHQPQQGVSDCPGNEQGAEIPGLSDRSRKMSRPVFQAEVLRLPDSRR